MLTMHLPSCGWNQIAIHPTHEGGRQVLAVCIHIGIRQSRTKMRFCVMAFPNLALDWGHSFISNSFTWAVHLFAESMESYSTEGKRGNSDSLI